MKNIKENISKESIQAIPLFVAYAIYLYFSKNNTEIFFEIVEIFCASIAGSIVVISGMQKEYKSFYKNFGIAFLPLSLVIFMKVIIKNKLGEYLDIEFEDLLNYWIYYMEYIVIGVAMLLTKVGGSRIISGICYTFTTLLVIATSYIVFIVNIFNFDDTILNILKMAVIPIIFLILMISIVFDKTILSKEGKQYITVYLTFLLFYQDLYICGDSFGLNLVVEAAIIKYTAYFVIYEGIVKFMFFKDHNEVKIKLENAQKEQKNLNHILNSRNKSLTEYKNLIEKSEKKYGELIESIKDGMVIFYFEKLYYINREAIKLLGLKSEKEALGKNIYFVLQKLSKDRTLAIKLNDALENKDEKDSRIFKVKNFKKDNREYDITLLKVDDLSKLIYIKDVTEINMNMKTKMEYEEYLKEEILKNEFYSNISHELRTPINLIFSALQLNEYYLNNNNILATKKNNMAIKQNCLRLIRTINNFIDANKISEGYLNLNIKGYNIVSVVENITLACVSWTDKIHNTLIFDAEEEEIPVRCDKDAIERIMLNLLSNSVKYGKENEEILVFVDTKEDEVFIHVRNKGYMIDKEILPYIFDRFTKLNKSLNREKEGSGLGLFLCKELLKLQGGTIRVECNEEVGTEFIITLPKAYHDEVLEEEEAFDIDLMSEKVETEFSDIYL
ncbi:MAG: ATP-binding protein [Clostridium sp.]|nr:HAMP domain-containing histidine kinase [Clostridium sp.]